MEHLEMHAQKKKRRFSQSENLRHALRRSGVSNSGTVANFLLSEFLCNGGRIRAPNAVSSKICKDKEFNNWRSKIQEKGWITYRLNISGKWMDYYPGEKLVKYINAEKSLEEMATRRELDVTEDRAEKKFHKMNERISVLERTVRSLIEEYDPPVTNEKVNIRLANNVQ